MQRPPLLSHQAQHTLLRSSRLQHSVLRLLLDKDEQPSRIRKLADCRVLAAATGSGLLSSCTCFTLGKHNKTYRGRCFFGNLKAAYLQGHYSQQTLLQKMNIRHAVESTSANIRCCQTFHEYQNMWCASCSLCCASTALRDVPESRKVLSRWEPQSAEDVTSLQKSGQIWE